MSAVVEKCVRPNVKNLVAYQSARSTAKGGDDLILLDAAENPYCPFGADEEWSDFQNLNRYPAPQPDEVLSVLSSVYQTKPENMIITRGSEEGIRLLLQTFCVPSVDKILLCPPTFGLYAIEANIHDTKMVNVPRVGDNFNHLDVAKVIATAKEQQTKIIFICNPGNPSSTSVPVSEVEDIVRGSIDDSIVVIDEAYIDFASHETCVGFIDKYPNVVILRTLSKGFGLAGLRSGAIISLPEIIGYIKRLTLAYPVPRSTALLTVEALSPARIDYMRDAQQKIKSERARLITELSSCPSVRKVLPSDANFLCVITDDAAKLVAHFATRGINIRNRSAAIPNAVNIAIGLPAQNGKVIEAFQTFGN